MTPAELYDSMHLPTTRWTPWRKREDPFAVLGDMTNGMVCEVERVPMIPKHPCYPADARVPKSQKKKDSVVSSGSKSRSLSTQSTSIVKGKGKQRERSLSAPIKEQGHGDPEDSDDSGPLCYQFLDAYCEPLSKGGSHISWAPTSPVMGPKNWWLEKKRRLSSTSFISPAGRRASSGTMGDVERGPTPVSREAAMCRRCFEPNRNGSVVKREGWKAAIGLTVANLLFPAVGGALILWSYVHPEMEDLFVVSDLSPVFEVDHAD